MLRSAAAVLLFASVGHAADGGYAAEIQKWRERREARLKADDGWLTVAGLYWLKDGANRFGSAAANEVAFPEGAAPPLAGVLELAGGKVAIRVEPGVVVTAKGVPVKAMQLKPDTSGEPDVLALGRLTFFVIERSGRLGVRLRDPESPQRKAFAGLAWFPVAEPYRIAARFVPAATARTIPVPNILGQTIDMPSPGRAVFSVGGKELGLDAVLEEPDAKELFFIFRDQTAGKETYPAGRFLYSELPKDGTVVLDFNKAYSPPCAFTPHATCPLPPAQNRLGVRIEAGEKYSPPKH
jgi:uncharacterized protein (DUF1684 family)